MRYSDIDCPPYVAPQPYRRADGAPATILELASRATYALNHYHACINARADFDATLRASGALARATAELTTAISDAVACGDGNLAEPTEMDAWRAGQGPRPGTKPGYW